MPVWEIVLIVAGVSLVVFVALFATMSAMTQSPGELGLQDGALRPCPKTPNCVCSQAAQPDKHVEAIAFNGDSEDAWQRIKAAIQELPRSQIVKDDGRYLHAEVRSALFRFADDVECLLDADAGVIHIRSASRAGRSDFGVNRARVEELRRRFAERAS